MASGESGLNVYKNKLVRQWPACLSHVTELPEYEITTVTTDAHGHKSV